jgi:hypothetical protein
VGLLVECLVDIEQPPPNETGTTQSHHALKPDIIAGEFNVKIHFLPTLEVEGEHFGGLRRRFRDVQPSFLVMYRRTYSARHPLIRMNHGFISAAIELHESALS